jgi:hypothetical protein
MYYDDTMQGYRVWLGDLPADVARKVGLGQRRGAVRGEMSGPSRLFSRDQPDPAALLPQHRRHDPAHPS